MEIQKDKQEIQLTVKRGLLDNRPRKLIINSDFIKFEDKDLRSDTFTQFDKDVITDYRFGIKWIKGFEFTIGREYQIFIRNQNRETLKINFKSLYGINKNEHHKLYVEILEALWDFYFGNITNNFLDRFYNDEEFSIANVHFSKDKLIIKVDRLIKEDEIEISWNKLGTKDYHTYFAIYSIENPAKINKSFSYLDDWNTAILYSLVRTILKDKTEIL